MKTSLKTLVVVIVLVLTLAVFSACKLGTENKTTTTTPAPVACEHTGGEATCAAAAVCEKCGESYGEPLAHSIVVREAVEVTCTEDGMTEGSFCSVCREVFAVQEVIPALGHDEIAHEAKDATCNEAGHNAYVECSRCDYTTYQERSALGHDIVADPEKKPTCTDTGLTAGEHCTRCDYKEGQEVVAALGHNEIAHDAKAPTCLEIGWDAYVTCSRCAYTTYVEKAARGHDIVVDEAKAPTCTDTGLTAGEHCTRCDYKVEQQTLAAAGHKDENVDYKCDVCKVDLCTEHIEKVLEAVVATCTTPGLTAGKQCSRCGHIIEAQVEIPALGHAYGVTYEWSDDNSTVTAKKICSNDASHIEAVETATVKTVTLNVTATKVVYTYAVEFVNGEFAAHTKEVEGAVELVNNIATINAPIVLGRVASHDFVKFAFHDASATYTFTIYYSEIDVWDGVSVSTSLQGSGTEEDPYLIQSAADLAYIAQVVNALEVKTAAFSGQYIVMTKSIDLNGYTLHIGEGSAWGDRKIFGAYFDGNNCSIRGINNTLSLFGCIEGGWAKNLSLYGKVEVAEGHSSVGVFVGYNRLAPLSNITNYASMNGQGNVGGIVGNMEQSNDTPATNLVNYGTITGGQNVGGIAGLFGRTLENCTNWGTISGNNNIGGIVGNLYWACNIINSYNYGDVIGTKAVGGIAGVRNGSIAATLTGCVNFGKVEGTLCTSTDIDGITPADVTKNDCVNNGTVVVAQHEMTHTDAKDVTCEADGNVAYDYCSVCKKNYDADGKVIANVVIAAKGHAWDAGVVGDGNITFTCGNCGTTRIEAAKYIVTVNHLNLDGTVAAAADALEFNYNEIATINAKAIDGLVASHDYVKVHVLENSSVTIYYSEVDVWDGVSVSETLAGTGTAEDPYLIQSAADLAKVAAITMLENDQGRHSFIGQYLKLTKSIDLNNFELHIGTGSGWGKGFNGFFDGNNCTIRNMNNKYPLFGGMYSSWVKNLSLYGKVESTRNGVAALACYTHKTTFHNVTNYATVTGVNIVGGLVSTMEQNGKTSDGMVNYGVVTGTGWQVGGLVGKFGGNLNDSVNFGEVIAKGDGNTGGLIGSSQDKASWNGTVKNCINYGTLTNVKAQIVGNLSNSLTLVDCQEHGEINK